MESIAIALLTALFTAAFGLLSYLAGQIILKLIDPILELRALIGIIAGDLFFYANRSETITSDDERMKLFRKHSSSLYEKLYKVLHYDRVYRYFGLPTRSDVEAAASELIGLSNVQGPIKLILPDGGPWATTQRIRKLLLISPGTPPSQPVESIEGPQTSG
jgi:hypothetical protein